MKEDHMRSTRLKPRYNIQFGVEGEFITRVSVSSERNDQLTMIPFLKKLRNNGIEYKDITADARYESEENYTYFENIKTECYIKPQNYEPSKTKKFKSNMALRGDKKVSTDILLTTMAYNVNKLHSKIRKIVQERSCLKKIRFSFYISTSLILRKQNQYGYALFFARSIPHFCRNFVFFLFFGHKNWDANFLFCYNTFVINYCHSTISISS